MWAPCVHLWQEKEGNDWAFQSMLCMAVSLSQWKSTGVAPGVKENLGSTSETGCGRVRLHIYSLSLSLSLNSLPLSSPSSLFTPSVPSHLYCTAWGGNGRGSI